MMHSMYSADGEDYDIVEGSTRDPNDSRDTIQNSLFDTTLTNDAPRSAEDDALICLESDDEAIANFPEQYYDDDCCQMPDAEDYLFDSNMSNDSYGPEYISSSPRQSEIIGRWGVQTGPADQGEDHVETESAEIESACADSEVSGILTPEGSTEYGDDINDTDRFHFMSFLHPQPYYSEGTFPPSPFSGIVPHSGSSTFSTRSSFLPDRLQWPELSYETPMPRPETSYLYRSRDEDTDDSDGSDESDESDDPHSDGSDSDEKSTAHTPTAPPPQETQMEIDEENQAHTPRVSHSLQESQMEESIVTETASIQSSSTLDDPEQDVDDSSEEPGFSDTCSIYPQEQPRTKLTASRSGSPTESELMRSVTSDTIPSIEDELAALEAMERSCLGSDIVEVMEVPDVESTILDASDASVASTLQRLQYLKRIKKLVDRLDKLREHKSSSLEPSDRSEARIASETRQTVEGWLRDSQDPVRTSDRDSHRKKRLRRFASVETIVPRNFEAEQATEVESHTAEAVETNRAEDHFSDNKTEESTTAKSENHQTFQPHDKQSDVLNSDKEVDGPKPLAQSLQNDQATQTAEAPQPTQPTSTQVPESVNVNQPSDEIDDDEWNRRAVRIFAVLQLIVNSQALNFTPIATVIVRELSRMTDPELYDALRAISSIRAASAEPDFDNVTESDAVGSVIINFEARSARTTVADAINSVTVTDEAADASASTAGPVSDDGVNVNVTKTEPASPKSTKPTLATKAVSNKAPAIRQYSTFDRTFTRKGPSDMLLVLGWMIIFDLSMFVWATLTEKNADASHFGSIMSAAILIGSAVLGGI